MLPLPLGQWRRLPRNNSRDLAFDPVHGIERLVPATLKLAGHEAIGGIDGVVLPTRMAGLVTRLLQRQLELPLRG
jgi:hypothetical protein